MNSPTPARPAHVPTLTEVVEPETAAVAGHGAQVAMPAPDVDTHDVPRNLMRGLSPAHAPEASAWQPAAMAPGALAPVPSAQDLIAARANLSGALRSARDGRWAPMPNVELPAQAEAVWQPAAAQLVLPELGALLETPPKAAGPADVSLPAAPLASAAPPAPAAPAASPPSGPQEVTAISEAQLVHRVLSVVQKQIDGMLDFRLREAMTPILQRHTDALVRDLRDELKQTMQDVINRAVAQEMAKVRQR
jgi:hypothetical protein